MRGVLGFPALPLDAPRPLRGQYVRKAVRKKGRIGRGGQIRGIWPWRTKPAERPICKESCKEKK